MTRKNPPSDCPYCGAPAVHVGLCHAHYERKRLGRPMDTPMMRTELERFWGRVNKTDSCWLWTGATGGNQGFPKYGRFAGKQAHHYSYELHIGPVPEGLELDHLCRVSLCVRPDHLEPVTHQENVMRGRAGKRLSERTHCKWGHEFDEANTHWATTTKGQLYRACRACGREKVRAARALKRAVAA